MNIHDDQEGHWSYQMNLLSLEIECICVSGRNERTNRRGRLQNFRGQSICD